VATLRRQGEEDEGSEDFEGRRKSLASLQVAAVASTGPGLFAISNGVGNHGHFYHKVTLSAQDATQPGASRWGSDPKHGPPVPLFGRFRRRKSLGTATGIGRRSARVPSVSCFTLSCSFRLA